MAVGVWDIGHDQFEFARWCEGELDSFRVIKVEIVSERERRFSTILQNLMTSADSTILKTNFAYDYKPRQHIFYRNLWWEITSIAEKSLDINPQALGYVNSDSNVQKYLEIAQVDL